jgi:glycerophosphoryl diester phosphodiesterase
MRHTRIAMPDILPADASAPLPLVIGHRGAAASAPENTLAGLRRAKALGCRWVEVDVRLTVDDYAILLHDDRLERTTNGRGKVSKLPLARVRRHDAGSWFDSSFTEERVPTLKEAVTLLAELGLGVNIELKSRRGRETATGTVVGELLTQIRPADRPELLVSSFQSAALSAVGAQAPGIRRGMLFHGIPKNWRAVAERLGCTTIHADHQRLRPAVVAEIRALGYPLLAYTVNDPGRAHALFDWGVTSVFSDVPDRLNSVTPRRSAVKPSDVRPSSAGIARQGST